MSDGSVGVPPLPESAPEPPPVPAAPPVVDGLAYGPVPAAGRPARRMLMVAALVGAVVGAGVVGAAWAVSSSGGSSGGPSFTLRGTLELSADGIGGTESGGCTGANGYDDIAQGTGVTVYDNSGQVVATGALGPGKFGGAADHGGCVFAVTVPDVPGGSKFYKVEVSHRGQIAVSEAEAKAGLFAASLG